MGCEHDFSDSRRVDPTQTQTIRRSFEADLTRRFTAVRRMITDAVVKNDVLGIGREFVGDAAPSQGAYAFARGPEKVSLFMGWLRSQQDAEIMSIQPGATIESASSSAWTNTYVETSYRRGIRHAVTEMARAGANIEQSWLANAFARPIHADRLGLLYTRTYSDLAGITQAMDTHISRILTEGIANGWGPTRMARDLSDVVDHIGITRARTLARTEVIRAHADATLNSYTEAGIEGVEVESEFATARDSRVCDQCAALEGRVWSIIEAAGVIPVHPNCRCAWIPKLVGGTGITLE